MTTVRDQIVLWANWGPPEEAKTGLFTYEEVRPMPSIGNPPGGVPWRGDCSSWITTDYKWGGAPDPNGLGYNGFGSTATLLTNGLPITVDQVLPGDVVVYGTYPGVHGALIVSGGANPTTSSMGFQGAPQFVTVNDTIPSTSSFVTYLRFHTEVPTEPPRPKSPAAIVGAGARPPGAWPLLLPKAAEINAPRQGVASNRHTNPQDWVVYLRQLLHAAKVSNLPATIGGYGPLTQNAVVRYKEKVGIALDGNIGDRFCGARVWASLGVGRLE